MSRSAAALLLAVVASGPAMARDPLAGRTAGPPQQCLQLSSSAGAGLFVLDDRSVGYRAGARLWRNQPIGRCSLHTLDTVVSEVFGGQLCRNDRIRTLSPGDVIPSAPCRLGMWVPYVSVK